MYGYLHKTDKQANTARGEIYKLYEGAEKRPFDVYRRSLMEAARLFFNQKKSLGPVKAFNEALTTSIKPEWLLWAVSPALQQSEHNSIVIHTRVMPKSPPWSS